MPIFFRGFYHRFEVLPELPRNLQEFLLPRIPTGIFFFATNLGILARSLLGIPSWIPNAWNSSSDSFRRTSSKILPGTLERVPLSWSFSKDTFRECSSYSSRNSPGNHFRWPIRKYSLRFLPAFFQAFFFQGLLVEIFPSVEGFLPIFFIQEFLPINSGILPKLFHGFFF